MWPWERNVLRWVGIHEPAAHPARVLEEFVPWGAHTPPFSSLLPLPTCPVNPGILPELCRAEGGPGVYVTKYNSPWRKGRDRACSVRGACVADKSADYPLTGGAILF